MKFRLLIITCLFPLFVFGQNEQVYHFTSLEKENGLPGAQVNRVIQDKSGFIWIATTSGLARYDGYNNIQNFNSKNTPALYSDYITTLEIDDKNRIYIGTRGGGLVIHDINNNTWKNYRHNPQEPNSLNNNDVLAIKYTTNEQIWVGTEYGINIYDLATDGFISYGESSNHFGLQSSAILTIYEDKKGWKWLGSWGGGFYLVLNDEDLHDLKFRQFLAKEQLGAKNIWCIQEDHKGTYWIGSHGSGLFSMVLPEESNKELDDQKWKPRLNNYLSSFKEETSLQNNIVLSLVIEENSNDIWFGTAGGISILRNENYENFLGNNPKKNGLGLVNLGSNETFKFGLLDSNITSIFQDNDGLIWICSSAGLNMYSSTNHQFDQFNFTENKTTLFGQDMAISNNKIWKSTGEHGFYVYDLKTNSIDPLTKKLKEDKSFRYISCVTKDTEENIWCTGTENLIKVNPYTGQIKKYPIPIEVLKKYDFFLARNMYVEGNKAAWICTELGLLKFDLLSKTAEIFDKDDFGLIDNSVTSIVEDTQGELWVGSYNGLNKIKQDDDELRFERYRTEKHPSLISNRILSLYSYKEFLFIGTEKGISVLNIINNEIIDSLNSSEPILTLNMIVSELSSQTLWGATSSGIFSFEINTGTVKEYTQSEGLRDNTSFAPGSVDLDKKGNILFGNDPGVVKMSPDKMDLKEDKPIVVIQSARYLNPKGENFVSLRGKKELNLNYNDYYLNLSFAGASYIQPKKNKYAYQLEGFDEDWMYTDKPEQIVYTNLKHGYYNFKTKMANRSGLWSDTQEIKINIKAAIWQTLWFRALSLLLLIILTVLIVRSYNKNILQRNIKLRKLNEQLKHEISERESIQEKLLQSQKSLIESNDELSRSNQDLEKFAHVASHDLKEPLRTIKSFNQLIQRKIKAEELGINSYMDLINSAVERMYTLIESILAFSSVDKGNITFEKIDLNQLISDKLKDLNSIIEKKSARVEMTKLPNVMGNHLQLSMLFQNLITNALKFNDKEIPVIKMYQEKPDSGYKWNIIVEDNGIGISKEDQLKVFELFQRISATKDVEGTGLGLAVCNKIINSHKGQLKIDSVPGQYCKFSVQLPDLTESP